MPKPQPNFTAEFKQEAVQLAKTSDKPKAQIARELGISDSALYSWCKAAEAHGEEAFPGKGHQLPLEEEIHRLKRELERTQQERDILKKSHIGFLLAELASKKPSPSLTSPLAPWKDESFPSGADDAPRDHTALAMAGLSLVLFAQAVRDLA